MEQVIVGGYYNTLDKSTTEYNRLGGGYEWDATEGLVEQLVSTDGKLKNLRVELSGVPGTGTFVFTVRLNGAPTTLTCEVAADGTTASDTVHEVTVTGGDRVCLECNPDSPDFARYARWTVMFESDTAKESLILGMTTSSLPTAARYSQVAPTGLMDWATEEYVRQVIPTAGKIKNLYVKLSADPGTAPDAYSFTLRLDNGGGFGDTALTCTITADDITGNDTANEVTVAAGDLVTLKCAPLESPSERPYAAWGMTFVADTDGESFILGGSNNLLSNSATEYNYLTGGHASEWTATELQRYHLGQVCTLKNLYVVLSAAPGDGKSYTLTTRVEGGDGNLTVTITGAGTTTGNDTGHTDVISDDDKLNIKSVPAGTPALVTASWSLVGYRAPEAAGLENKSANMGAKMIAGKLI